MLLDVTLEVDFCTFWKEALATLGTTAAKTIATCFGAHTGAKAVLTFTDSLGRLISAFHDERRS